MLPTFKKLGRPKGSKKKLTIFSGEPIRINLLKKEFRVIGISYRIKSNQEIVVPHIDKQYAKLMTSHYGVKLSYK